MELGRKRSRSFACVWDALANTTAEAANLKLRAELMRQVSTLVHDSSEATADAARRSGITRPRLDDLFCGRISRFTLDALIGIAARLGRQVRVKLTAIPG